VGSRRTNGERENGKAKYTFSSAYASKSVENTRVSTVLRPAFVG